MQKPFALARRGNKNNTKIHLQHYTTMKKILISALLPLLYFLSTLFCTYSTQPLTARAAFFSVPVLSASADEQNSYPALSGGYACILTDSVFFYSSPDEKRGVFLLPKSYYVKILDYKSDYCKIEYLYDDASAKKLTGYAKTDQLTFVDYVPQRPYLYYVFDVHYYIDDTINDSSFLNQITATCTYYGDYRIGSKTYCYVLRGETFGYVPKPSDLRVKENLEYETYLAKQETTAPVDSVEDVPNPPSNSSSPAQIAILVVLCLLIPVLSALILRPQKRRRFDLEE